MILMSVIVFRNLFIRYEIPSLDGITCVSVKYISEYKNVFKSKLVVAFTLKAKKRG